MEWGYRARNIVSGGKKLKAPEKEARFLSYGEAAKLFKAVKYTRLWVVVGLGVLAGLRKGKFLISSGETLISKADLSVL
jgi:integrase